MRKEKGKEKRRASKRIILSMLSAALFSALILSACGRGTKTDTKAGIGQDEGTETKVAVVESSGTEEKAEAGQNTGTEEKAETGQNTGTEEKEKTGQSEGIEVGTSDAKQQPGNTEKVDWDDFCGQWVLTGFEYGSSVDDDEPSADHTYYLSESERDSSQLLIYNEENKLYADYYRVRYGSHTINGMALVKKEASPDGMPVAQLKNRQDEKRMTRTVMLRGKNELRYCERDAGTETEKGSMMICTYLREGSKELENAKEYQYFNEVTVSTVEELAEAIRGRTKIILKEGEYNFSALDSTKINNPNIDILVNFEGQAEYTINNIRNLCIEAEEGAKVVLSTELPYAKALAFENCEEITLRGLTCGHEVEPGFCTGSVIYFNFCNNLEIDNCHLYGSGTYGVEAYHVFGLTLKNSDIYDCSYGLIYLSEVEDAGITNCRFTNSREYSMFSFVGCYNMLLKNCVISGNQSDSEHFPFINCQDSLRVGFTKCTFENNEYKVFLNEDYEPDRNSLVFEDCMVIDEMKGISYPNGIIKKTGK